MLYIALSSFQDTLNHIIILNKHLLNVSLVNKASSSLNTNAYILLLQYYTVSVYIYRGYLIASGRKCMYVCIHMYMVCNMLH